MASRRSKLSHLLTSSLVAKFGRMCGACEPRGLDVGSFPALAIETRIRNISAGCIVLRKTRPLVALNSTFRLCLLAARDVSRRGNKTREKRRDGAYRLPLGLTGCLISKLFGVYCTAQNSRYNWRFGPS